MSRRDLQANFNNRASTFQSLVLNTTGVIVVNGDRSRYALQSTAMQDYKVTMPVLPMPAQVVPAAQQQGNQSPYFPNTSALNNKTVIGAQNGNRR